MKHPGLGGLPGGLGQAEAKDPINSCGRLGAGEGVFPEQEEERRQQSIWN